MESSSSELQFFNRPAMSSYLFTYGTLHPDRAPREIAAAVALLEPVERGFVRGALYDLGEYPGAVLDATSEERISGTVFRLPDDAKILRQFDRYEGFAPNAPQSSLFLRVLHAVELESGRTLECWIYVLNETPRGSRILPR